MTTTYQAMPSVYAWPRSTNGLTVAAFVAGVLGWVVLSIPFGFAALHQIKSREDDGRGLAIAGLAVSAVWIIIYVAMMFIPTFIWSTATPIPPSLH